jgi:hypothetical protein
MTYLFPLTSINTPGLMEVGAGLSVTNGVVESTGISSSTSIVVVGNTSTQGPSSIAILDGMTITPGAGNYLALFNSQFSSTGTSVTESANIELNTLISDLSSLTVTGTHSPTFITETITAGVYTVSGAATLGASDVLTLDGGGDSAALFVFRISAAFSTGAGSSIVLINGADIANVFWLAGGAVSTGATSTFSGTLIGNPGAASTGAGTIMNGRLFTVLGAIPTDSSTITVPTTISVITLGILAGFALFTSSGNIANTGTSTINGNIGTNSGTISGFGAPSVVNGTLYTSGIGAAVVEYGIYANGVLLPVSYKIKQRGATEMLNQELVLQAIATVADAESIDVRFSVDIGTIVTGNRILSLIKVI